MLNIPSPHEIDSLITITDSKNMTGIIGGVSKDTKEIVVIDELFVFTKKTLYLPIAKKVTRKVNNCRKLESKDKRKSIY